MKQKTTIERNNSQRAMTKNPQEAQRVIQEETATWLETKKAAEEAALNKMITDQSQTLETRSQSKISNLLDRLD